MADKIKQIQESPFQSMLILSVPIILLLLFNESYVVLDTQFLTQLGNSAVIAFGYIAHIYYFINRSGKGIGRGVSSIISRLIGGENYESVNNTVLHGILMIIVLTVLSQIVFALFSGYTLPMFIPKEQYSLILIYLQCLFLFLLFIFISEYLVEIMNGEGDTRLSTAIMVLGVILNAALDYIFILPCKMGILGASLGTSVAYMITTAIFLYIYIIRKDHLVKLNYRDFSFEWGIIREILINSIPIILDSLVVTLTGLFLMNSLKNFAPPITIVAFILIMRVQMFLFTPIQGLSRSCNIVIGHLFGAGRFNDAKKQLNSSILISFVINGAIILILAAFFNVIIAFFTQDLAVMAEVKNILNVVMMDLIVLAILMNSNQALIAIGRSPNSFYSVIVKFVSLAIYVFILCNTLNFAKFGALASLILSDMTQGVYSYLVFRYYISKEE